MKKTIIIILLLVIGVAIFYSSNVPDVVVVNEDGSLNPNAYNSIYDSVEASGTYETVENTLNKFIAGLKVSAEMIRKLFNIITPAIDYIRSQETQIKVSVEEIANAYFVDAEYVLILATKLNTNISPIALEGPIVKVSDEEGIIEQLGNTALIIETENISNIYFETLSSYWINFNIVIIPLTLPAELDEEALRNLLYSYSYYDLIVNYDHYETNVRIKNISYSSYETYGYWVDN